MYDALDIRPCSVDGRVESKASLVDPEVGATPVHYLTLEVNLHLDTMAGSTGLTSTERIL